MDRSARAVRDGDAAVSGYSRICLTASDMKSLARGASSRPGRDDLGN
jgi:hypothetical protein